MPSIVRPFAFAAVALVSLACISSRACAQSADRKGGPENGTWAAEAATGGGFGVNVGQSASLLRFVSPSTALIGGLSVSRTSIESQATFATTTSAITTSLTSISLQAGVRRYARTGLGLRPLYGAGVLFSRQSGYGATDNSVGGYAEAGAAWFFNPHVSLGATGSLSGLHSSGTWSIGGTLARLTGAVYF
jgi:hypothetical protein